MQTYKFVPGNDMNMFEMINILRALELDINSEVYRRLGNSRRHFELNEIEEVAVKPPEPVVEPPYVEVEQEPIERLKPSPRKIQQPARVDFGERL